MNSLRIRMLGAIGLAAAVVASAGLATSVLAAPPSDEQIAKVIEQFKAEGKKVMDGKPDPKMAEFLAGISISEASVAQLEKMSAANMFAMATPEIRGEIRQRLTTLAAETSVDGAVAAALVPGTIASPGRQASPEAREKFMAERAAAVGVAANHPAFAQAIGSGRATTVFADVARMGGSLDGHEAIMTRMVPMVTPQWPVANVGDLLPFASAMLGADGPKMDAAQRETLRTSVASVVTAASKNEAFSERQRSYYAGQVELFNGAAMRGALVGQPAPAINVLWSHGTESPITGFDSFKGKIVVVDFWATWCGPCIAAFPHMREMQARYQGKDVVLLGVTSLQGFVIDHKATDPKARKKDAASPEAELAMMTPWIKDMEVTWPIVVTKQNCFNPDFAVNGIPHMALIDPDGKVYLNNLSPWDKDLEDKIDALLTKFNRPVPPRTEKKEEGQGG